MSEPTVSSQSEPAWIPVYPDGPHDLQSGAGAEIFDDPGHVRNIHRPAIAPFPSHAGEAPRPAVIICPGGGYGCLSIKKEGYEVAQWFNAAGYSAFVLKYRLADYGYPAPLSDLLNAVALVRRRSGEFGIDPGRLGVLGFSAGGHLAGMACTIWDSPDARIDPANTGQPLRPDFGALIYPVVTLAGAAAHAGSRANLLGADPDPRRVEALSLESRVSAATPPLFLVHGANDAAVPAANSLQLASRMVDHGVPVSLHLYANGPHGFGMLPGHGPASAWPARLREWLAAQVSP